ncbi:hypothetical protein L5876_10430 [Hyphobacterium sp. SN044]|uniref:hypothetical protein n=1 Tax=Hyphobacterium sp. SN044 TaxID=2912575 RepID=UPI001F3027FB|nr:hypothetical protein [Hyphobacterium sp. SN044]MCF8880232.1 hypothetical protein [Hyphobacterium sp. SN044]
MPVLPTAHASQSYGRRQLEFFATTGHIASPERKQRASERRFQDMDGGMHTVRLVNGDAPMETGDSIAVLRAQSGPDRQSRPVSVINYRTNSWEPAAPDATRALSRAGITRGANWWLSMIAMALFAIVLVWPALRAAFIEINPSLFGGLPDFNLVGLAAAQAGFLIGADPAASIGGLDRVVASTGLAGPEAANAVLLGLGLAVLGLIAYVGRTWRVVWVPLFLAASLATGLVLAGTEGAVAIALMAVGGLVLFFALAGFINRVRDASRFRGRVARLSEHMLRNPPQESVVSPPPARNPEPAMAAAALSAGAVAAANDEADRTHADPAEDAAEGLTMDAAATETDAAEPEGEPEAAGAVTLDDTEDAPRTLSAGAAAEDATLTRDARTSAAFGALAAAMEDDTAQAMEADDDLPSDADLARARGEGAPDEAVVSLRAPEAETPDHSDRDMTMPEPPPLAAQPGAMASAPQAGEDETGEAEMPDVSDPEPTAAAVVTAPVAVEDLPDETDTPDPASDDDNDPMMSRDDAPEGEGERRS